MIVGVFQYDFIYKNGDGLDLARGASVCSPCYQIGNAKPVYIRVSRGLLQIQSPRPDHTLSTQQSLFIIQSKIPVHFQIKKKRSREWLFLS